MGSTKYLLSSLDQSLKRMGLEYVDIFYSHRPDPDTPLEETMRALDQAVRQEKPCMQDYRTINLIRQRSIGNTSGFGNSLPDPPAEIFDVRTVGGSRTARCPGKGGYRLYPFPPLAQGLLTDRYLKGIPAGSRASKPHGFLKKHDITPEKLVKIQRLNEIAVKRGQSLAQMAIAVELLKDNRVTSVLAGASSVQQLGKPQSRGTR